MWHIALSPDNKTILSTSLDGTSRMWNTDSGDELFQVTHNDTIHAGSFSHDGRKFATCSHDGIFKVCGVPVDDTGDVLCSWSDIMIPSVSTRIHHGTII